jgi:hypothetical protein
MGLIAAFTWLLTLVSVSQACGVRVIVAGSEELTAHSSGLCWQKRTKPGTGLTAGFIVAREVDREGGTAIVWASDPPLTSSRARAKAAEWNQLLRKGRTFERPRRNSRIAPPL